MKAVVTGAAGFIGSAIAERLLDDGHEVTGIDLLTDYYAVELKRENVALLQSKGMDFTHGDLNELELGELLAGTDVIFHEAGQPGVRGSWGNDFHSYTIRNINATQRLLEAAKWLSSLKRFVYASSSSVYGDAARYPVHESDVPHPISPYGVSKLAAEHLCGLYGTEFDVPTVSLRYFTVYGPRQRPDLAIHKFTRLISSGKPVPFFGDGTTSRDYTFVEDTVSGIVAALEKIDRYRVYNLGGSSPVSLNTLIEELEKAIGKKAILDRKPAQPGDVERTYADLTRSTQELGYAPKISLAEGLKRFVAWFNEFGHLYKLPGEK